MSILNKDQFKNGKDVEAWLDKYFKLRGWSITQTTPYQERVLCLGDRHFRKNGRAYRVEYKSGIQTFYSGNIFLETVSVDATNRPGWVYSCKADYILYAALLNKKILVFLPDKLRGQMEMLKARFREVATKHHQNDGYNTHGVIVPLKYAEERLAVKVIRL